VAERRSWIEPGHELLSVRQQCALLGLHRSNLYYEPVAESSENLQLLRSIDELYLEHPHLGSCGMVSHLARRSILINRKKMRRMLGILGLQSIAPKPRTTIRAPGQAVYPYLLRGLAITRPNHVWACDITYVPMQRGYLYLVAVMDWFSRHVLAWRPWTKRCLAAVRRYSTRIKGRSSRVVSSRRGCRKRPSRSAWMAQAARSTT
jgi:putative transposase